MKKILAILFLLLLPGMAAAANITVSWTLPTTAVDGSPLTGSQALTSVQVFIATAPIADASTTAPTATLTATATTTNQVVTAAAGQTLYARIKACNSAGCSVFSNQATKLVPVSVPGVPTSVTITLNIE
jgi:hypothetical protein